MLLLKITDSPEVEILGCVRCDTAVLPKGEWAKGGPAALRCPLCGMEAEVSVVEVGDGFPFNPAEQREDAAQTPVYRVTSVTVDEDMVLVTVDGLLTDPAFYALQKGAAPVASFGWVGGEGLLGEPGYRLFLVVRVADVDEFDLFRVEFPANLIPELRQVTDDRTIVLVSEQKGVLFPEAGDIYLQAVAEAGGKPGDSVTFSEWAELQG